LSENFRNAPLFKSYWTIQVKSGGDTDRGYFEVVDGVLRLMDKQGLFCEFTGVESRNGVVYAVGVNAQIIAKSGLDRTIMHERVPLGKNDFGICISSHVSYASKTLPVLLDSLRKAKFDMRRVVAVVGGYKGSKTEEIEGAKVVYQEENGKGFGGLVAASDEFEYWLLLHDTCEAERSFVESFVDVDIGLNPDVVRLREDIEDWTGFYKTVFVNKIKDEIRTNPDAALELISRLANVITVVAGKVPAEKVKDIYGTGNKRLIEKLPVGIRKYRGMIRMNTP
jgi:hypothetical protein